MAKLTDKSAIVTLSLSDLIHVVDVDDLTSDPLGTSKKASIRQIVELAGNVTHTGEVTGATVLTVDKTAITNKTTVTGVSGDFVLISDTSDAGNLKKVDVVDFLGGAADGNGIYDGSGSLTAATTVTNAGFDLFIMGAGNLGLGTITPTAKLDVVGSAALNNIAILGTSSTTGAGVDSTGIQGQSTATNGANHYGVIGKALNGSNFSNGGLFQVESGASVVSAFGTTALQAVNDSTNSNFNYGINSAVTSTSGTTYGIKATATGVATRNYGGYFSAENAVSNYALITDQGNVGIGTGLPTEKFEVAGNTKITGGINVDSSTFFVDGTTHAWSLGRSATPENDIRAVTIGYFANTFNSGGGSRSIAIGYQTSAVATGTASNIAIGYQAKAPSGDNVISIGDQSGSTIVSNGSQTILFGYLAGNQSTTIGTQTIAIGDQTDATGIQATLLGSQAEVAANFAIAIGRQAKANHLNGIAIGLRAETGTGTTRAYVIASGTTGTVNSVSDSLAVGFNEATPRFLFAKTADSYLNGSGNVGIGTTTPSDKLEVIGNLNATRYKVNGVAGANFSGAVTNITVVDGLVTIVS